MLLRDDSVRSQIQHHQFSLPQTGNNIIQNTIGLQVKLLYMHGSKDHLSSHSRGPGTADFPRGPGWRV